MIKVGIVGVGIVAREHAKAIAALSGEMALVAAADLDPARLASFCADFKVAQSYASAEAMIAQGGLDLVVIATPPSAHEPVAVAALDAGLYVFCEKPLAHSLASAARILAAEARHPGKLGVSYQFRHGLPFRRLDALTKGGWLGEVQAARLERHSYIPHSSPGSWWGAWDTAGGGVLITQLIHELDMLLLLMGPAASVQAVMDTRFTGIESEDYVEALIRFRNGASARCIASVNSGHLGGGLTLSGSAGAADLNGNLRTAVGEAAAQALGHVAQQLSGMDAGASPYIALYRQIGDAVRSGAAMPIGPEEAMASLDLCMAIYESAITGRAVDLPLGASSSIYEGVSLAAYAGRQSNRFKFPDAADDPPVPSLTPAQATGGLKATVRRLARIGLERLHMRPDTVRALARRPAQVNGGPKTRRMPWPRRQLFTAAEKRAALRVINREIRVGGAVNYAGPEEEAYCNEFSHYMGGGYTDAVNSGSNAIYIAIKALKLPVGGEVIVPPITDPGAMMPVALSLCVPVPCDSAPGSIMPGVEQIRAVMTDRTCAIMVAHMAGHPVDMDPILALARERGIPVIEDCAQAHGTVYKGRKAGTLGTIAAFSTMFGKHHATGGQGGAVYTRDLLLMRNARQLADRGKALGVPTYPGNQVASLNFNQDEISMAIGRVQLAKLPASIHARRRFAAQIAKGLDRQDGVWIITEQEGCESSYWFLMLGLDLEKLSCKSGGFAQALSAEGIDGVYPGYAVYPSDQPWFRQGNVFAHSMLPWSLNGETPKAYPLPNAHATNEAMVRIEIHDALSESDGRQLIQAITKVARFHRA